MKAPNSKLAFCHQAILWIGSLVLCCLGISAGSRCWGQAAMPPTPPDKAASVSTEDRFYAALEDLSKKYRIAFVAEGTPFPTPKDSPGPLLKEGYIPEPE